MAAATGHGEAASAPLRWSVLEDPAMEGARNMARDHALAESLPPGEAVLRIYRWARPTLSFGRNEPARGLYDSAAAQRAGIDFVRRPTGGRAVLHDRELTYAVLLPLRSLGGARSSYRRVNAGLVWALRALGVPAQLADVVGPAAAPDAGPCFQLAAAGEVTVRGRKLVGSAQVRLGGTLLQHGSLLLAPGQERIGEVAAQVVANVEAAVAPLAAAKGAAPISILEVLGCVPEWKRLVAALVEGLSAELEGQWDAGAPPPAVSADREARLLGRYASDSWTWRR